MTALLVATILLALGPASLLELEQRTGLSDVRAALGNGQLAAGVSARGDLTALRWPGPGLYDQLHYQTALPVAGDPPLRAGAQPAMGLFTGLIFEQDGVARVEWLHEGAWEVSLSYLSDSSSTVRVEYRAPQHDLELILEYWLAADRPLLALRVEVLPGDAARLPTGLIFFENLAPCDQRVTAQPIADWRYDAPGSDSPNDFGLFYSAAADALLHFRPQQLELWRAQLSAEVAAIGADASGHLAADALVDRLTLEGVPGSFAALGADLASVGHQVGRYDPGDAARPQDAYFDAADGQLRGQPAALGSVDGALALRLPVRELAATLYLSLGASAGAAMAGLEQARLAGFASLVEEVSRADAELDRVMATPDSEDPRVRAVARRAIRALLGAQDPDSGAVVAAVGGQPPLALDCPAWSAWVDEALGEAALHDQVSAHRAFLRQVQRRADDGAPAGSFWSCYDSAGGIGGGLPFPIEATGLTLWAWWRHAERLRADRQESRARSELEGLGDAMELAAEALLACRDDRTGLTCPASEGDDPTPVQGLLGAATAVMGLEAAAAALDFLNRDEDRAGRYSARATELRQAVEDRLRDPQGHWIGSASARALALFPAALVEADSAAAQVELDRLFEEIEAELALEQPVVEDLALRLWILAELSDGDRARRTRLKPLVAALFELADPGTDQYGAVLLREDRDGDGQDDALGNRVATPFLPAGALAYLTALRYHGRRPPLATQGSLDACFCAGSPSSGPGVWLVTTLLMLGAWRRRRGGPR